MPSRYFAQGRCDEIESMHMAALEPMRTDWNGESRTATKRSGLDEPTLLEGACYNQRYGNVLGNGMGNCQSAADVLDSPRGTPL